MHSSSLRILMTSALAAHLIFGAVACGPDDPATDENNSDENNVNNTANGMTSNGMTGNTSSGNNNTAANNTAQNNMTANNSTANNNTASNTSTPSNTVPNSSTPNNSTPNNSTPNNSTPNNSTPNNSTPNNSTPNNSTPNNSTPNNSTPNNTTPDPCANVTCPASPPVCDGDEVVSVESMCVDGMCVDSAENRVSCADDGKVCVSGMCEAPVVTVIEPTTGDLIITEVLYDSDAVDDDFGEWFEIYNTTDTELSLADTTLSDDSATGLFVIPAGVVIPAKSYLVFGVNDDPALNGGVLVDVAYSGIKLGNSGDTLTLTAPDGAEITSLTYGGTFPDPTGRSIGFDGALDLLTEYDAADSSKWCGALAPWAGSAGDFGTPGAANDICPTPVMLSIKDIQDETSALHPAPGDSVELVEVVLTALTFDSSGAPDRGFAQDLSGGPYSGIYLDLDGIPAADVAGANVNSTTITLKGVYEENNGNSQLKVTDFAVGTTLFVPITPETISVTEFADPLVAEKWEGVLVRINEPAVTNDNPDAPGDFGEFTIDGTVRVDDLLYQVPAGDEESDCEVFDFIQGPVNYSFGNFKLEPRDANDFGLSFSMTPQNMAPKVSIDASSVTPPFVCVYSDTAAVSFSNTTNVDVTVLSREPADGSTPATPELSVTVPANMDTSVSMLDEGTYHYSAGMSRDGAVIVLGKPDPNTTPAGGTANPGDLVITEIMYDPTAVGDAVGEWIELYNTTSADIDINGFNIHDSNANNDHTITSPNPVIVPASSYVLLGRNDDITTNGGVVLIYASTSLPSFNNSGSGDDVTILDSAMTVIDTVSYNTTNGFPDPSGASIQFNTQGMAPVAADATLNNTGAVWCESTTAWPGSAGDSGTPGAQNSCPVVILP